jgi:EAL and modified HD-GYP domain-containing signal transduction protein
MGATSPALLLREALAGNDGRFAGYRFAAGGGDAAQARHAFAVLLETPAGDATGAAAPKRLVLLDTATADALDGLRVASGADAPVATLSGARYAADYDRCRSAGFRVGVTLGRGEAAPSVPAPDLIVLAVDTLDDPALATRLKATNAVRAVTGQHTPEANARARAAGAQYHGGTWQRHVATTTARPATPAQAVLVDLINLAQAQAPVPKIEQALKRDATVSFRLLRYINSAGFGLAVEVQSIRHAITMLGYRNLQRWLSLLLATAGTNPASPLLTREAAVRGRVAELVAHGLFDAADRENLFLAGVFSLLPAILQMSIATLVEQVAVPEAVTEALLDRSGLYGPVLALAEALDSGDATAASGLAEQLALDVGQVNASHVAALRWADLLGV